LDRVLGTVSVTSILFAFAIGAPAVLGQDEPGPQPPPDPGETVVRPDEPETDMPGRLVVVSGEEIRRHAAANPDWGSILSKAVPGLATSTESLSNGGQSSRGRVIAILIDGVPQSTPLRNSQRDLRIIDPSAVERVEVRHLPAGAVYGASGTVVNFVTRRPKGETVRFQSEAAVGWSLSHSGDSLRARAAQSGWGRSGDVGYAFAASWETIGGFFDAEGDRIPPNPHLQGGIADSESSNLFGKLAWDAAPGHSFELMADRYTLWQDTDYATVAGVPGGTKAGTTEADPAQLKPGTRNFVANLSHVYDDGNGLRVVSGAFFQDYLTRFPFNPMIAGQSFIESVKRGVAVSVELPIRGIDGARLSLALDWLNDRTAQPLTDGRTYAPRMIMNRFELVAQAKLPVGSGWTLKGGGRQESIDLDVETYETLIGGDTVQGGRLEFRLFTFNLGIERDISAVFRIFGGYARTFHLADIGLDLQLTTAASVEDLDFRGQKVHHYELGARAAWKDAQAAIVFFYSQTNEGLTFGAPPFLPARRRAEFLYGGEITFAYIPSSAWTLDAALASVEGRYDLDDNGSYEEWLPGYRVPPLKIVVGIEGEMAGGWRNRLQVLHSGWRDRFGGSASFGEGKVETFTLVTVTSAIDVGGGVLRVAIENALNQHYFPVLSSAANLGLTYSAGAGAALLVSYEIGW
jgi:iron complex outermembrane receptor protein